MLKLGKLSINLLHNSFGSVISFYSRIITTNRILHIRVTKF